MSQFTLENQTLQNLKLRLGLREVNRALALARKSELRSSQWAEMRRLVNLLCYDREVLIALLEKKPNLDEDKVNNILAGLDLSSAIDGLELPN